MKKAFLICFFSIFTFLSIKAQVFDKHCYYGIIFEMSTNPSWGEGELVITAVDAHSPAEKAGIKVGDIIMEINGQATYLRDNQTIARWLFDNPDPLVKFTIRNMDTYFKEYDLYRECFNVNTISEEEMSKIYSFYSLEDTQQRSFILPIYTTPNTEVDYTDYHTYDFYNDGKPVSAIDAQIMMLLDKELKAKGLSRDTNNPDIIVQAYYSYEANPNFTALSQNPNYQPKAWRYNSENEEMVSLPAFDVDEPNIELMGQYIIEFGFSLYDNKKIDALKLTQIWDCNIKDYLADGYELEKYALIHIPLMLMQFPYTQDKIEGKYTVSFNRYNYTGLHFNATDAITVGDVDDYSPAYEAGLRSGYVIKRINNKIFNHTQKSLSDAYMNFISETMVYRDQSTRFTDAQGFADCMYWNTAYYDVIGKVFKNPTYATNFSYLYDFQKYVDENTVSQITIEAWDGMQLRLFHITPIQRKSVIIKAL